MKNNNSSIDDFTKETKNKLLFVTKKILSKAELSTSPTKIIWFEVKEDDLKLAEYELIIKKVESLWFIDVLDERYLDIGLGSAIFHPVAYKLNVHIPALREFAKNLEENNKNLGNQLIQWPEYYGWDESGRNYLLGDGKKVFFQKVGDERRKIFDCLVKRKGDWVRVSTISEELKIKDKRKISVVINQLRHKLINNSLTSYLQIESFGKNRPGMQGAYRIVPA